MTKAIGVNQRRDGAYSPYEGRSHGTCKNRAAAEVLRLNPNFSLEVGRQSIPVKDQAVLERDLAALRRAG
jgi:hypothetical protein